MTQRISLVAIVLPFNFLVYVFYFFQMGNILPFDLCEDSVLIVLLTFLENGNI